MIDRILNSYWMLLIWFLAAIVLPLILHFGGFGSPNKFPSSDDECGTGPMKYDC